MNNTKTDVVLISMQHGFLPTYAMLYLETYLNKAGIKTEIFYPIIQNGLDDGFIKKITQLKPRIIGISGLYDDRFMVKELIGRLAAYRKDFKIVVGGNLVSPIPEYILKKLSADIVVIGEGELIFTKLAESILGGQSYTEIKGIVFLDGNDVISTGQGEYLNDLNTIPPLNYDKMPMEYYIDVFKFYKRSTRISEVYKPTTRLGAIPTGRGCIFKCNFCYHSNNMRQISVANIISQVKEFKKRFNINLIRFLDELTFMNKKQALELCKAWIDEKINLNYMISAHFSSIDEDVILALKESGCVQIGVGLESGSQEVLDRMNKRIRLEQIKSGLELFKKHNFLWNGAVQIGQIGETAKDIQKTINFCYPYINERASVSVCITTPYPGSTLYNHGLNSGLIKSHDEAYDKIRDLRKISFNFSKINKLQVYYLRYKMILMFDIKKLIKSKGIARGMWYFFKTLFLKVLR